MGQTRQSRVDDVLREWESTEKVDQFTVLLGGPNDDLELVTRLTLEAPAAARTIGG